MLGTRRWEENLTMWRSSWTERTDRWSLRRRGRSETEKISNACPYKWWIWSNCLIQTGHLEISMSLAVNTTSEISNGGLLSAVCCLLSAPCCLLSAVCSTFPYKFYILGLWLVRCDWCRDLLCINCNCKYIYFHISSASFNQQSCVQSTMKG